MVCSREACLRVGRGRFIFAGECNAEHGTQQHPAEEVPRRMPAAVTVKCYKCELPPLPPSDRAGRTFSREVRLFLFMVPFRLPKTAIDL